MQLKYIIGLLLSLLFVVIVIIVLLKHRKSTSKTSSPTTPTVTTKPAPNEGINTPQPTTYIPQPPSISPTKQTQRSCQSVNFKDCNNLTAEIKGVYKNFAYNNYITKQFDKEYTIDNINRINQVDGSNCDVNYDYISSDQQTKGTDYRRFTLAKNEVDCGTYVKEIGPYQSGETVPGTKNTGETCTTLSLAMGDSKECKSGNCLFQFVDVGAFGKMPALKCS